MPDPMENETDIEVPGEAGVTEPEPIAPEPEPGEGEDKIEHKVVALILHLAQDQEMSPQERLTKAIDALKMIPCFNVEGEPTEKEPVEEAEFDMGEKIASDQPIEPTLATGGVRTGGKDTAGREPGEEGEPQGGMIPAKDMKVEESISSALLTLKNSGDPSLVQLSEALEKRVTATNQKEQELQEAIDRSKAQEAWQGKVRTAKKLCKEKNLQESLLTPVFLRELAMQPNEKAMINLIEDRKAVAGTRKPISGAGFIGRTNGGGKEMKTEDFARSVKSGLRRR